MNTITDAIPDGSCVPLPVVLTLPLDDLAQLADDVTVVRPHLSILVCSWCYSVRHKCW